MRLPVGASGLGAAVALAALLVPRAGAEPSEGFYTDVPPRLQQLKPGALIRSEPETTFLATRDGFHSAHRVLYRSTGELGQPIAATTQGDGLAGSGTRCRDS
jgi:hypothetical protein